MTDIRITQSGVEVLRAGVPAIRTTQAWVEVLRTGVPDIRVTHADVEVLRDDGYVRIAADPIEVSSVISGTFNTTVKSKWIEGILGEGPWDFTEQKDKWGYLNNPDWSSEEDVITFCEAVGLSLSLDLEDKHYPCGHWHKKIIDRSVGFHSGRWVAAKDQYARPFIYLYDITYKAAIRIDTSIIPPVVTGRLVVNDSDFDLDYNRGYGFPGTERGGYCINKNGERLWYLFNGQGSYDGDCRLVEVDITSNLMRVVRTTDISGLIPAGAKINDGCSNNTHTFWCTNEKAGRIIKIRNSDHSVIDNHEFNYPASPTPNPDESINSLDVSDSHLYWSYVRCALHEVPSYNARAYHCRSDFDFDNIIDEQSVGSGFQSPQWQTIVRVYGGSVYFHRDYHPLDGVLVRRALNLTLITYANYVYGQALYQRRGGSLYFHTAAADGDPRHLNKINAGDLASTGSIAIHSYTTKYYSVTAMSVQTGVTMVFKWDGSENKNYGTAFDTEFNVLSNVGYNQIVISPYWILNIRDEEPVVWPSSKSNWIGETSHWGGI